jgi:hypothetical protein
MMLEEQLFEHLERAVEPELVATTHPVPLETRLVQRLDRAPGNRQPPVDHRFPLATPPRGTGPGPRTHACRHAATLRQVALPAVAHAPAFAPPGPGLIVGERAVAV